MATYAIGDIQGCYRELRELIALIGFDSRADRLWFTGDLVNRGPDSLEVLRYVRDLGDRAITVLGNHDLHLLACAWGDRRPGRKDTFTDVLDAPDRESLLQWLRARPLLHHEPESNHVLVHAGLPPQWDATLASACADEIETTLRGADCAEFLRNMYGHQPDLWSLDLQGIGRLRFSVNAFTRMRYCTREGRLELDTNGPPGTQPDHLLPWYAFAGRQSAGVRILFGHWATLGLVTNDTGSNNVICLDTGCVWGGSLTALRIDDGRLLSVPSHTK